MMGLFVVGCVGIVDNVVGVEVIIDGMLVIVDWLYLVDFFVMFGIWLNIL